MLIFTRMYKTKDFKAVYLGQWKFVATSEVKYLGVILDPKIDFKRNIEGRVKAVLNVHGNSSPNLYVWICFMVGSSEKQQSYKKNCGKGAYNMDKKSCIGPITGHKEHIET